VETADYCPVYQVMVADRVCTDVVNSITITDPNYYPKCWEQTVVVSIRRCETWH